jgi:hypothetical protein
MQPVIDKSVGGLVIGGSSRQKLAQVVTVGLSGLLMAVKMPVGGSSGDLIIETQDVAAGKPGGTVLSSATFNSSNCPAEDADGMRRFDFPTLVHFAAGGRFAIVLRAPGGSYGMFQGPAGDSYPGGGSFYNAQPANPDSWIALSSGRDLPFKTIVSP